MNSVMMQILHATRIIRTGRIGVGEDSGNPDAGVRSAIKRGFLTPIVDTPEHSFVNGIGRYGRAQAIPSQLHKFYPFSFISQRDARHPVEERFFLDASGVGHDDPGILLEDDHAEIPDRTDEPDAFRPAQVRPNRCKLRARAGVYGPYDGK